MRPQVITKQLTAASTNNIALVQAPAVAGALTLTGAAAVSGGVATLDTQRRIGITSAGNDSGRTFTVKGTLQSGKAITESVTGANVGVASTLQDFFTVTEVDIDGAAAGNVSVGTTAVGSTPWIMPDTFMGPFEIGFEGEIVSGAATWSIETTQNSPLPPLPIYQTGFSQAQPVPTAFTWPGLAAQVANAQGAISGTVIAAWRLTITAGQGNVRATAIQSGLITG